MSKTETTIGKMLASERAAELAHKIYEIQGLTPLVVGINSPQDKISDAILEALLTSYEFGYQKRQLEFVAWLHT